MMILSHNNNNKDLGGAWLGRKESKFEADIHIYVDVDGITCR